MSRWLTPSEGRRRQLHFVRARRRWKAANPDRPFKLDYAAVYLCPADIRPRLPSDEVSDG